MNISSNKLTGEADGILHVLPSEQVPYSPEEPHTPTPKPQTMALNLLLKNIFLPSWTLNPSSFIQAGYEPVHVERFFEKKRKCSPSIDSLRWKIEDFN